MPDVNVKKQIIFHIGAERTGTTSLQNYLARNPSILAQHAILYPTRNLAFHHNNHIRLVSTYLPQDRADDFLTPNADRKDEILTSLMEEIAGSRDETILISAEHFSSRFRLPQIQRLAADFAAFDCTIVMMVREPISRFFSAYATHVASGGCMTLTDFADQILLPDNIYARYAATIDLWRSVFGKGSVKVCVPSRERDLFESFFDTTGKPIPPCRGAESNGRDNKSLGQRGTETLRRANMLLADAAPASAPIARWLKGGLKTAIQRCLHLRIITVREVEWRLEPGRLKRLLEIARADIRWLERHYGLRLKSNDKRSPLAVRLAGQRHPMPGRKADDMAPQPALGWSERSFRQGLDETHRLAG